MKLPIALIFAHARRNWFRSILTVGSVFIAIFVFGAMRTVVDSLEAAVQGTSSQRMITESATLPPGMCGWFTTLVSKSENLSGLERTLRANRAREVRTMAMAQGQKKSRILAWRF